MQQNTASRHLDKFMVRFPEGLRERLAASARANRRSMNAELIIHLEAALADDDAATARPASTTAGSAVTQFSRD